MNEKIQTKEVNLKLTIISEADYHEVKPFLEFAESKGWKITIVDNGNIIFSKARCDDVS